jgi:RNA polymerase sigma-70 factor (sigma-E family)
MGSGYDGNLSANTRGRRPCADFGDEGPIKANETRIAKIDSADRATIAPVSESSTREDRRGNELMEDDFDAFVRGHLTSLTGFGRLLAGHDARAQDLVQEALARTYLKWRRSGAPDDPHAYVRRAMVNLHSTWWRRLLSRESPGELPESAATADDHDLRLSVWSALQSLPPRQRAVVVLRYYEGLTETEVGHLLECSVGTVKSQSSKALAKLRVDPAMLAAHTGQETEL